MAHHRVAGGQRRRAVSHPRHDLAAAVARELSLTKALAEATAREQALAKNVSDILVREQALTDGLQDSNVRLKAAVDELNGIKGVKVRPKANASSPVAAGAVASEEPSQDKWRDGREDIMADFEAFGSKAQDVATGLAKAVYGTAYVVGRVMEGINRPRALLQERISADAEEDESWMATWKRGRGLIPGREGRPSVFGGRVKGSDRVEARVDQRLRAELEESERDRAAAVSELSGIRVQYDLLRNIAKDLLVSVMEAP